MVAVKQQKRVAHGLTCFVHLVLVVKGAEPTLGERVASDAAAFPQGNQPTNSIVAQVETMPSKPYRYGIESYSRMSIAEVSGRAQIASESSSRRIWRYLRKLTWPEDMSLSSVRLGSRNASGPQ
jgi:hypothetical protein